MLLELLDLFIGIPDFEQELGPDDARDDEAQVKPERKGFRKNWWHL